MLTDPQFELILQFRRFLKPMIPLFSDRTTPAAEFTEAEAMSISEDELYVSARIAAESFRKVFGSVRIFCVYVGYIPTFSTLM